MEARFGKEVATEQQVENYRKMLLSVAEDARVIRGAPGGRDPRRGRGAALRGPMGHAHRRPSRTWIGTVGLT